MVIIHSLYWDVVLVLDVIYDVNGLFKHTRNISRLGMRPLNRSYINQVTNDCYDHEPSRTP